MRLCERIGLDQWADDVVVVDIQNVQDYMVAQEESDEDRYWRPSDFPSVVSPWPMAAYEWTGRTQSGRRISSSVFLETHRLSDGLFRQSACVYLDVNVSAPAYVLEYGALANGPFDEGDSGMSIKGRMLDWYRDSGGSALDAGDLFCTIYPILMANSFLACKNVSARDVAPRITRQMRRHGPLPITYKVLDIGPATRILNDEGDAAGQGIKRALHICRGHFAHYTPDALLFGKYEGTFWHPMHLRGNRKSGVVVKDYRVQTPNAQDGRSAPMSQ